MRGGSGPRMTQDLDTGSWQGSPSTRRGGGQEPRERRRSVCFGGTGVQVLLGYWRGGNVTMSQSSGLCGGEEAEGRVLMRTQRWQLVVLTKAWGRWNCPDITVAGKGPRTGKHQKENLPWDQKWEGACRVREGAAAEVRRVGKKSDTGDKPEKYMPPTVQRRAQRGKSCGRSVSKQSENFQ